MSGSTRYQSQNAAEHLIDKAEEHGATNDPDHEIGDLQALLRDAWAAMNQSERAALGGSDSAENALSWLEDAEGDRTGDLFVETLIEGAHTHAEESDPDHEAGDLQDMLRDAWALIGPDARAQIASRFLKSLES